MAADVACAEVDRASRDVIADAGWADAFSHSTGHGVGLEIHEARGSRRPAGDTLLLGDVVTVEPGVYLPGIGGVRIEDTARRRRDGRRAPHPDPQGSRAVSISTNDLKNGMALNLPEGLVTVVEFQHVKPGKGGAFVRTKLKNVRTGAVIDRTFRADEKVKLAVIDKREMQFLYREGADYVFMDNETYDQLHVSSESVGDAVELPEGGRHRGAADLRGRDHRCRSPGVGRARRSPRPSRACRAIGCRARARPRRSRPVSSCRCRCS